MKHIHYANNQYEFGSITKILHWLLFLLLVGLVATGKYSASLEGPEKIPQMIANHKQVGVAVFILMLFRMFWRLFNEAPRPFQDEWYFRYPMFITHWLMYIAVLAQAAIGVFMSQASGRDVTFFGLELPTFFGSDGLFGLVPMFADGKVLREWHTIGGDFLIGLVALHVFAAVVVHHLYFSDDTLRRMFPGYKATFADDTHSQRIPK